MIEGLKVTIEGVELRQLCMQRAQHHRERAQVYAEQIASMEAAEIQGANYTNGDPIRALKTKHGEHINEANELEFYGAHIDFREKYLLDHSALNKLGIVQKNYY